MGRRSELRNQRRNEVVETMFARGEPVNRVAHVYDIGPRTVFDWLSLYRAGGWDALKEGRRSGRPRKISGGDMKRMYRVVTQGNSHQFQFVFHLWTLKTLRTLIERELGIQLSKSSIGHLRAHLELSARPPVDQSYRQHPRIVNEHLADTFAAAPVEAGTPGVEAYFADEASVRSDAHRGATWGMVGETAIGEYSGGRFTFNLISAVSPRRDMRLSFIAERIDFKRFIEFLKKLRRDAGEPALVFVDNVRYHHSKERHRCVESQQSEVPVVFVRTYTPEFKPDEQVWNHEVSPGQAFDPQQIGYEAKPSVDISTDPEDAGARQELLPHAQYEGHLGVARLT
jgi:transposase